MAATFARPYDMDDEPAAARGSIGAAIVRVIVVLLAVVLVSAWIGATAYWIVIEESDGEANPLASLRAFIDGGEATVTAGPEPVRLVPPPADIQVVWASSTTSRAPVGFAGVDLEPRWELEWEVYPVARITRVSTQSVFADYLCAGDAVLSVDGEGLNGQTPDAMTRAFEEAVFGKQAFSATVAPAGGRGQIRLMWGPLPVNAQELAGAAVTTSRPACRDVGG